MTEHVGGRRVAQALLIGGGALAVLAVGAWTLDAFSAMPVWTVDALTRMPAWMLRLAVYKLTLGSGAALMLGGAVLRRELRAVARARSAREADALPAVGAGAADPIAQNERAGADAGADAGERVGERVRRDRGR